MNISLLKLLICPNTGSSLYLENETYENGLIKSGVLYSENREFSYNILNFIPRFVSQDNYANNFGWQWNKFKKTQFDSYSGHPITYNRFWAATNWGAKIKNNEWILDAGCGSGRFAEISSDTEANIVAIDYSNAVDACYENLGHKDNLFIIQCDIYNLPFKDGFFDKIYSLGVLQHTPDVKKAVLCLSLKLKKEGYLCIDFYEKSFKSMILPKYWLRPMTKKMKKEKVFSFLEENVDFLLKMSEILNRIPLIGKLFSRLVPIANYNGVLPLDHNQIREWAILDTFDWLTPTYDNPQTKKAILKWLQEFRFENIEVLKEGHIVGRGKKV
jgi:SAM-dependent methyltransferase